MARAVVSPEGSSGSIPAHTVRYGSRFGTMYRKFSLCGSLLALAAGLDVQFSLLPLEFLEYVLVCKVSGNINLHDGAPGQTPVEPRPEQ